MREGGVSVQAIVGQLQIICGEKIAELCCGTVALSVQIANQDVPVGGEGCFDGGGNTTMIGEPNVVGGITRAIFSGWLCGCGAGSIGIDLCAVEETHHHVWQTVGVFGWTTVWRISCEGGILSFKVYGVQLIFWISYIQWSLPFFLAIVAKYRSPGLLSTSPHPCNH